MNNKLNQVDPPLSKGVIDQLEVEATGIETFANTVGEIEISYSPMATALCSIGMRPFKAYVHIEYRPADKLLEFASFERWLESLKDESMTIEELTRLVFDMVSRVLGDIPLRVSVHATTTVHAPVNAVIERSWK